MIAKLKKAALWFAVCIGVAVISLPLLVAALALFVSAALVIGAGFVFFKLRG